MKRIKDAAASAAMTIGLVLALAFGESLALASDVELEMRPHHQTVRLANSLPDVAD